MSEILGMDLAELSFSWDEQKERLNFAKHGIHFSTAVKVFGDPDRLIRYDAEHTSEERYDVIGKIGKVYFVVCTIREKNTVRIISARLATAPEKRRYENGDD